MKKITAIFLVTALTAAMIFGCGGKEETIGGAETETAIIVSEEVPEEAPEEAPAEETAVAESTEAAISVEEEAMIFEGTLEELFATPEGKTVFESIKSSLTAGEQEGFSMEISVKDNTVYYELTFDDGIFEGVDTVNLSAMIDDLIAAQEESMVPMLESLNSAVTGDCALDMRFVYEGEVLSQKTMTE